MQDLFPPDYRTARERFLGAARDAEAELAGFGCPSAGPCGEVLFTDTARLGAQAADRVLVIMSGTHGVEGLTGSAIQTGLLRMGVARSLPPGSALLMIHALNPFGFAHLRRVNENNVDLNRNFLDFSQAPPSNPEYDHLADVIAPLSLGRMSAIALSWRLFLYRRRHGLENLQKAVTCGQYTHPQGLFYGGNIPSWSNRTLRSIIAEQLVGATRVAVIDLHTGLGPRGYGEIIVGDPPGTQAFKQAKRWWGERVRSTAVGESVSAHLSGTVRNAFSEALPGAELTSAGLEFGTLPAMEVFRAMRAENWLHHHGAPDFPAAEQIKRNFRQAFSPDDAGWREMVWKQGEEVVMKVLDQF